jgi:hypothetical protein
VSQELLLPAVGPASTQELLSRAVGRVGAAPFREVLRAIDKMHRVFGPARAEHAIRGRGHRAELLRAVHRSASISRCERRRPVLLLIDTVQRSFQLACRRDA